MNGKQNAIRSSLDIGIETESMEIKLASERKINNSNVCYLAAERL